MDKNLKVMLLSGFLVLNTFSYAHAESKLDTYFPTEHLSEVVQQAKGKITISLGDTTKKVSKENVVFGIKKVAEIENGEYISSSSDLDFNNLDTALKMEETAIKLTENVTPDITVKTDKDGYCEVNDLDIGVYLIYVVDQNKYDIISPSLISIPYFNEDSKEMAYEQSIVPKHTPVPEEKVDTGDNSLNDLPLYLSALGVAGIGMVGLSLKGRKNGKNEK